MGLGADTGWFEPHSPTSCGWELYIRCSLLSTVLGSAKASDGTDARHQDDEARCVTVVAPVHCVAHVPPFASSFTHH